MRKTEMDMLDLNKKLSDYKMMALRSAMNPHFIFNSLNSIQYYISKNEKKLAINYLSLFSKLIRNILNSSVNISTSLDKELEVLEYYIQLEKLRFEDKFQYRIEVDEEIDKEHTMIPSLILQPFVENAILHGLVPNHEPGELLIRIEETDDGILCTIQDNGIGREEAIRLKELQKKSHISFGVSLTSERLGIINKTNNVAVKFTDLRDEENRPTGTKVELSIEC
jgi:sensor histidine kinase YesM